MELVEKTLKEMDLITYRNVNANGMIRNGIHFAKSNLKKPNMVTKICICTYKCFVKRFSLIQSSDKTSSLLRRIVSDREVL